MNPVATFNDSLPQAVRHLATVVAREACARGLCIATAESCTGGLLASVLTDVEGCSHAFERGFVVYTDDAKRELVGVDSRVLETDGAVSEAAARQLAEGALKRSKADIALSITGFAGPGGPSDEAGLVFMAVARKRRPTEVIERHYGDAPRSEVRAAALADTLKLAAQSLNRSA